MEMFLLDCSMFLFVCRYLYEIYIEALKVHHSQRITWGSSGLEPFCLVQTLHQHLLQVSLGSAGGEAENVPLLIYCEAEAGDASLYTAGPPVVCFSALDRWH